MGALDSQLQSPFPSVSASPVWLPFRFPCPCRPPTHGGTIHTSHKPPPLCQPSGLPHRFHVAEKGPPLPRCRGCLRVVCKPRKESMAFLHGSIPEGSLCVPKTHCTRTIRATRPLDPVGAGCGCSSVFGAHMYACWPSCKARVDWTVGAQHREERTLRGGGAHEGIPL